MKKKHISVRQIPVLTLLVVICVLLSGCGKKAHEEKVYRVGIISGAEDFVGVANGFKAKMTELGYIEGKNIIYDFQKLNVDPEGEKRVARKFVEDNVDLIFSCPTEPSVAAKDATQGTNIPVVFAMAGIEGTGLVESVRQPGGHITGVRYPITENTVKRLEILQELAPQAKRVYLIYDPDYPIAPTALAQLRPAASALGITLVEDPVNNVEELLFALQKRATLDNIGIDAILLMPDILNNSPDGFGAILKFGTEHKVPIGGIGNFTADLGAIFSFAPDAIETGELAAPLADKIFKGIPAGTIPVVTPEGHLRINYKAIQKLGLEAPEGLLSIADEVIH